MTNFRDFLLYNYLLKFCYLLMNQYHLLVTVLVRHRWHSRHTSQFRFVIYFFSLSLQTSCKSVFRFLPKRQNNKSMKSKFNWNTPRKRISVSQNPFLGFVFYWEIRDPDFKIQIQISQSNAPLNHASCHAIENTGNQNTGKPLYIRPH